MLAPSPYLGHGVTMARFPLERYAATEAARACVPASSSVIAHMLMWCNRLGQFIEFDGGFICWLRSEWTHVPLFETKDFAAIADLGEHELRTGPVVYFADGLSVIPGVLSIVLRELERLPGAEAFCAHVSWGPRLGWTLQPIKELTQ